MAESAIEVERAFMLLSLSPYATAAVRIAAQFALLLTQHCTSRCCIATFASEAARLTCLGCRSDQCSAFANED